MGKKNYKYIYGPVPSWRLGSSLGVDPISASKKTCSFDCVYCQIGKTGCLTTERKIFVPTGEIVKEISLLPEVKIDYITFAGAGEPTLARNMGDMIRAIRGLRREKVAVLTNSSIMDREDVREDLSLADLVVCKLDASSQDVFEVVNSPAGKIQLDAVIRSIKGFRSRYKGTLALQIMFIGANKHDARRIARIAKEIAPDEIQLNTPLRPCGVKPLTMPEMSEIEKYFSGMNIVSVYRSEKRKVRPISSDDTIKRRGKA